MSKLPYRPEIDGLRAVAVIPVLLFHLNVGGMSGGYLGVDVFFVISGYLITNIILREIEAGEFRFSGFWTRRVRRIMPSLLATIITTQLVCVFFVFKQDLYDIGFDSLSAIGSYANIQMWAKVGDYWGAAAETSPFLHAWSLSVEEQFYLLYPALVVLMLRFSHRLLHGLFVVFCFSLAVFFYGSEYHPTATFYLLPTRAWELAAGGLVAVMEQRRAGASTSDDRHGSHSGLAFLGVALIVWSYFVGGDSIDRLHAVVAAVAGAALFVWAARPDTTVGKALSCKPAVYIGKVSYSAYLVHWPIIVVGAYLFPLNTPEFQRIGLSLGCIVLATLLLHYGVENPTRKFRRIYSHVGCLVFIAVLLGLQLSYVESMKTYPTTFDPVKSFSMYYDVSPYIPPESRGARLKRNGVEAPPRSEQYANAYLESGIPGVLGGPPEMIVIGDSNGSMWGKTIDEIATKLGLPVGFFTTVGDNPLFHIPLDKSPPSSIRFSSRQRDQCSRSILQHLDSGRVKLVVIVCLWSHRKAADYQMVEQLVAYCGRRGTKVLLLSQPPEVAIGDRNSAQFLGYLGYTPRDGMEQHIVSSNVAEALAANKRLQDLARRFDHAKYFDVYELFSRGEHHAVVAYGRSIFYFDNDHLSYQGTTFSRNELESAIRSLLATP